MPWLFFNRQCLQSLFPCDHCQLMRPAFEKTGSSDTLRNGEHTLTFNEDFDKHLSASSWRPTKVQVDTELYNKSHLGFKVLFLAWSMAIFSRSRHAWVIENAESSVSVLLPSLHFPVFLVLCCVRVFLDDTVMCSTVRLITELSCPDVVLRQPVC